MTLGECVCTPTDWNTEPATTRVNDHPSRLFRKFVDTPGAIEITAQGVVVRLNKRAHNPLLKEAGLMRPTQAVPWLSGRCVHLMCP